MHTDNRIMELIHEYLQSTLADATGHSGYRNRLQDAAYKIEDALPVDEREKLEATGESTALWLDMLDTAPPESLRNEVIALRESGQVSASFIKDLERLADLRASG